MPCRPQASTNACSSGLAPSPYRFCTHTTGATARASASWAGVTPDKPRCRISPACCSSASAPNGSATEVMLGIIRRFTTSSTSRPSCRRFSSTWPRSWSGRAAPAHRPDGSRAGPTLVTMTSPSGYGLSAALISSLAERSGEK